MKIYLMIFLAALAALGGVCADSPDATADWLLREDWKKHRLNAVPASDCEFVRRARLALTGRLPSIAEAKAFAADEAPDKRARLVERLSEGEEFADYWTEKWCDVLRVKSEFPINLWPNAVYVYTRYIRQSLLENKRFNQLAVEMLLSSGSNFRDAPVNFYRASAKRTPEGLAEVFALTFLGMRYDKMPEPSRRNLAAFFANVRFKSTKEWKEEIVYALPEEAAEPLTLPDGRTVLTVPGGDRRELLAEYLLTGEGRRVFAAAVVSRTWFWLMGRGLVEPADDLRADQACANTLLFRHLCDEFIRSGYDFQELCRMIAGTAAFQASSSAEGDAETARRHFAAWNVRRLDAEVIDDTIGDITGSRSSYSSVIPEPFTFVPRENRTITLADGSLTSQFLIMFGRPARDSGLLEERNNEVNAKQRMFLMNSGDIFGRLGRVPNRVEFKGAAPKQRIELMYWLFLSRPPTEAEAREVLKGFQALKDGRARWNYWVDLGWILLNTGEFIHQH